MTILTGDYNVHHKSWYSGDNTDDYGHTMQEIFEKHSLYQTVNQPTYITSNSHTCIDLVATDQPNIIIKNDIAPSLHPTCHHQINFVKLDLKCPLPPPFKRLVWHYARANVNSLRESIRKFDWATSLDLLSSSPDDQVDLFDNTIMNIAKNFIPNSEKTFIPRDPPWLTKSCKALYRQYHRKYTRFVKRGYRPEEKKQIDDLRNEYSTLVNTEKETYLKKLGSEVSDPRTSCKKYWTCLKRLLNKNNASIIPPILDNGLFVTDIREKCSLFNSYFKISVL